MHHALGVARGTGGEEHRGDVARLHFGDFGAKPGRIFMRESGSGFHQLVERLQARLVVAAQAARFVVIDVGNSGALRTNFNEFVDLLLVFDHGKAHFGVVQWEHAFRANSILVQRHRNRAQRLHCQHGGVQARAVGANHHHVLAAAQPRLVQTRRYLRHQTGQLGPAVGLPNAIFFFTQCRCVRALAGMLDKQLRERGLHPVLVSEVGRWWDNRWNRCHGRSALDARLSFS